MNKVEFCANMAERTGMSKAECQRQYDNVMGNLFDFVSEGEEVSIFGVGSFKIDIKEEREARNPATGDTIVVPAHKAVKFKVSKALKDAVKALSVD